jgi:hypothetical protein
MPSLKEIIEFDSKYTADTEVTVDERFPTVSSCRYGKLLLV